MVAVVSFLNTLGMLPREIVEVCEQWLRCRVYMYKTLTSVDMA